MVSPVMVCTEEFNRPVLGHRIWGTYNVFPDFWKKPARGHTSYTTIKTVRGFTGGSGKDGTDKVGVNTFGFRVTGRSPPGSSTALRRPCRTVRSVPRT